MDHIPISEGGEQINRLYINAILNSNFELIKYLIENSNTFRLDINCKDSNGNPALVLAAKRKDEKMVALLLTSRQIDINLAASNENTTALFYCAKYHLLDSVQLLVKKKEVHINTYNNELESPLSIAVKESNSLEKKPKIVNTLLMSGAYIDHTNKDGNSVLMQAVLQPDTNIIGVLLIQEKINLNLKNNKNDSVLSLAIKENKLACFKELIQKGKTKFETKILEDALKVLISLEGETEAQKRQNLDLFQTFINNYPEELTVRLLYLLIENENRIKESIEILINKLSDQITEKQKVKLLEKAIKSKRANALETVLKTQSFTNEELNVQFKNAIEKKFDLGISTFLEKHHTVLSDQHIFSIVEVNDVNTLELFLGKKTKCIKLKKHLEDQEIQRLSSYNTNGLFEYDFKNQTALMYAVHLKRNEVIKKLLEFYTLKLVDKIVKYEETSEEKNWEEFDWFQQLDENQEHPKHALMMAASYGNVDAVKLFTKSLSNSFYDIKQKLEVIEKEEENTDKKNKIEKRSELRKKDVQAQLIKTRKYLWEKITVCNKKIQQNKVEIRELQRNLATLEQDKSASLRTKREKRNDISKKEKENKELPKKVKDLESCAKELSKSIKLHSPKICNIL